MNRWVAALAAAILSAGAAPANGQCCGDCNADGTVTIGELVSAVNHTLDGCQATLEPLIVIRGVSLPSLAVTLGADVAGGRVNLAMDTDWSGSDRSDRSLFNIAGQQSLGRRVELAKNGSFLNYIITDNSGRDFQLNVRIDSWQPGPHTVTASWGQGSASITIDGVMVGQVSIGEVVFAAGDDLLIGSRASVRGTTFHDLLFAASP